MTKDFFKFTPQHLEVARTLKVNELKLWLYLSLLDPFGDRSINLPPLEEIEEKTGLKKSAYYKARAKISDLGLWDFTEKKTIAHNIFSRQFLKNDTQFPKNETHSVNGDSIPEKWDSIPEKWENSLINQDSIPEKWENRELKPREDKGSSSSQTLQTYQTFSYSPDVKTQEKENIVNAIDKIQEDSKEEVQYNYPVSQKNNEETQASTLDLSQDKNFRRCNTNEELSKKPKMQSLNEIMNGTNSGLSRLQERHWQWLPDGDWKNSNGKLDPDFQEWLARKWLNKYNTDDIFEARANVLSCFRNDPLKLPIHWQRYHDQLIAKRKSDLLVARQIEVTKKAGEPVSAIAKAVVQDFCKLMAGKSIDRPISEQIEIINYALSHWGRNKYFFRQAQQLNDSGWKVTFNENNEPLYVDPNSKPNED